MGQRAKAPRDDTSAEVRLHANVLEVVFPARKAQVALIFLIDMPRYAQHFGDVTYGLHEKNLFDWLRLLHLTPGAKARSHNANVDPQRDVVPIFDHCLQIHIQLFPMRESLVR